MLKKIVLLIVCLFFTLPAFADDSSIIPVLWLFCKNEKIKWQDWNDNFKNVSYIYEYNGNSTIGIPVKAYEIFGGNIYEYNGNSTIGIPVKAYEIFGGNIYEYNGNSTIGIPVKAYELR